jgi:hypothetical protein
MVVRLGSFPLCPQCQTANGGLVAVQHRQVHLNAYGKEACVDRGLAGLIACLWSVCDTSSCCEDDGGRMYVVPTADTRTSAVDMLSRLGLDLRLQGTRVYFPQPASLRLDDYEAVRQALVAG